MTVLNPPGFLQNAGATHTAESFRNWSGIILGGARASTSLIARGGVNASLGNKLQVTQSGSPGMSVIVKSGHAAIMGTEGTKQGVYMCLNDADVTLSISAAHATLNRIDSIIFKVQDSQYSGGSDTSSLVVVTGTPAASPAVPTLPANCIQLATVSIVANDTSITNGEITDTRVYLAGMGGLITVANQAERDALLGLYDGMCCWRRDTKNMEVYNGTDWGIIAGRAAAWTDFSASLTITAGGGNPTKGNSVYTARYKQNGKDVLYNFKISIGSTFSAGSGTYNFLVPVAAETNRLAVGKVFVNDSGTALLTGICTFDSDTTHVVVFLANITGAALSATGPGTAWATGDTIVCSVVYEAA